MMLRHKTSKYRQMAFLSQESIFNPDQIDAAVIGIASDFTSHDSGLHQHQRAQLLFAPIGCMTIASDNQQSILPPTMAAWIPPQFPHRITMRNVVAYRSIYFDKAVLPDYASAFAILHVNGLLKELIERISYWPWDMPIELQKNTLSLFWEEFNSAPKQNLTLLVPQDARIKQHVELWNQGKSLPSFLKEFAKEVGASEKTISRIFLKETGMTYQDWRQQWRLQKSIEWLAEGKNVSETAFDLEFSSDSAFIEFFKKYQRQTPHKYFNK
ncbi:helix-turn-helix transcriptional regulator [Flavobacterium sp. HSC-61S13]|uniref:AraC family transcriptional regulator n=1 Tax=Flavobacterium sp. HSC-61S13 TaxID=2910963 RepID=UPI0035320DA0|nr:AraC-like DNA-binding protein [Flavobacterium sp. HSC-61S13]